MKNQGSRLFGLLYLAMVPAFGFVYWYFGLVPLKDGLLEGLYFSAVTITTLGYGDIAPVSLDGKLVAGFQAISGIVVIGLFLNSLSQEYASAAEKREKEIEKVKHEKRERARLLGRFLVLNASLVEYFTLISQLGVDMQEWQGPEVVFGSSFPEVEAVSEHTSGLAMKHLDRCFLPSLLLNHDPNQSWLNVFCVCQGNVRSGLQSIVHEVDLDGFQEIRTFALSFLTNEGRPDHSAALLQMIHLGNSEGGRWVRDSLANWDGPATMRPSNSFNSFVVLLNSLKFQPLMLAGLVTEYQKLLEDTGGVIADR